MKKRIAKKIGKKGPSKATQNAVNRFWKYYTRHFGTFRGMAQAFYDAPNQGTDARGYDA